MKNSKKDYQQILGSIQKPVIGEAGKTGTWSSKKPLIDLNKCIPVKSRKPSFFNQQDKERRRHYAEKHYTIGNVLNQFTAGNLMLQRNCS